MGAKKRIVVDACIARAAGPEGAVNATSSNCRDFLLEIYQNGHSVVFNRELKTEWDKHESTFARFWLARMIGSKRLFPVNSHDDEIKELDSLNSIQAVHHSREAVKDAHLIFAAHQTDKIVSSLEKRSRDVFKRYCNLLGSLSSVFWVHIGENTWRTWIVDGRRIPSSLRIDAPPTKKK